MKTTTLMALLLLSLPVFGQMPAKQWKAIPKNTTSIEINNSNTASQNFKLVSETLLDNNFEITKRDKELGTITTGFKALPRAGTYKLNARCKNNKIIISGQFNSGISIEMYGVRSENEVIDIEKTGSYKSTYGRAFGEMYNFSQKLGEIRMASQ